MTISGHGDAIFWLRFYRGQPRDVAVLTNVPGNPAYSITNMVSRISDFVAKRFSVDLSELIVFEIWPRRDSRPSQTQQVTFTNDGTEKRPGWRDMRDAAHIDTAPFTGSPEWWDSDRDRIEALVDAPLPGLPEHEELYARVLALGGGTVDELWRPMFSAIDVRELPLPHNPSSCHWVPRFRAIEKRLAGCFADDELAAGREFLTTLSPEDRSLCEFHAADWAAIADESVRIIDELGSRSPDNYVAAVDDSPLAEPELGWLDSLFRDPIDVKGGSYTNGQHRGCALRFSGAERAAVVTGYESLGEVNTDWTYGGDG